MKSNHARNGRLQQGHAVQDRLLKDGELIGNNDAQQVFHFLHVVLAFISYREE
jgi:hypothetical protein